MVSVAMGFPPETGTTRDYALAYLAHGWSVIPVKPLDKRPLVKWEPYQAERATVAEVEHWLAVWPDCNLGLVTGAISGVVALDIDGAAGVQSLRDHGRTPPATLLQKTPHGWHAVYALNGTAVKTAAGILPHVDTRGDGGYIVVAPSRLGDGVYRWHARMVPVPVPEWMERETTSPIARQAPASAEGVQWIADALRRGVEAGARNATATRLAGYLHSKRLPDDVVLAIMAPFGARCTPPIDDRELLTIVQSVARYAPSTPPQGRAEHWLPLES